MNQQIRDALAFYADPKSYVSGHNGPDVMRDGGVKAKEALASSTDGWRPIATAPKAGWLLLATECSVGTGGWNEGDPSNQAEYPARWEDAGGFPLEAIAWMPLPNPPKVEGVKEPQR